jgi:hypothetical protein
MENPPLMQNRLVNTKLQYFILSVLSLKINKNDANDHYIVEFFNFKLLKRYGKLVSVYEAATHFFFFLKENS